MTSLPGVAFDELLRRVDYDRYLASLFADSRHRPHLFRLYAFNYEVAKTAESVSQPIAGQIRLQWWRDRIAEIYCGTESDHPLTSALAETITDHDLPRDLFDALIDARESDLEEAPFGETAELEAYANATSSNIIRLAARILGANDELDADARGLGTAYALAGLLRALPHHASHRHFMFPREIASRFGVSIENVFAGESDAGLASLLAQVRDIARAHFRACAARKVARRHLPAILPATLVPLYLRHAEGNPFRDFAELPIHRRQLPMLVSVIRGRI